MVGDRSCRVEIEKANCKSVSLQTAESDSEKRGSRAARDKEPQFTSLIFFTNQISRIGSIPLMDLVVLSHMCTRRWNVMIFQQFSQIGNPCISTLTYECAIPLIGFTMKQH